MTANALPLTFAINACYRGIDRLNETHKSQPGIRDEDRRQSSRALREPGYYFGIPVSTVWNEVEPVFYTSIVAQTVPLIHRNASRDPFREFREGIQYAMLAENDAAGNTYYYGVPFLGLLFLQE